MAVVNVDVDVEVVALVERVVVAEILQLFTSAIYFLHGILMSLRT